MCLCLWGCAQGADEVDLESRLLAALPDEDLLEVSFPVGGAARKPGSEKPDNEKAETLMSAGFVDTSALTAASLNSSIRAVLGPLRRSLLAAARASGSGRRIWSHEDALGRTLLAIEEADDGHVEYALATRSTGGPWAPLMAGSVTLGPHGGQGAVWVDLRQDASPKTSGRFLVLYDFDDSGERSLTLYSYGSTAVDEDTEAADAPTRVFHFQGSRESGTLIYSRSALKVRYGPGQPFVVRGQVITRWTATGGRVDVIASGGDLEAAGYAGGRGSECWDRPGFKTTYAVSFRNRPGEDEERVGESGDSSACAFTDFAIPSLPSAGLPPPDPELPPEAADSSAGQVF